MLPLISSAEFPLAFATQWIANWNARNVTAVLSHFHDDCIFESPIAANITGRGRLVGKEELQKYWNAALARIDVLRFSLDDCIWDPVRRTLVVAYTSLVDGRVTSCCEMMVFDAGGRQTTGKAYYGFVAITQAAFRTGNASVFEGIQ